MIFDVLKEWVRKFFSSIVLDAILSPERIEPKAQTEQALAMPLDHVGHLLKRLPNIYLKLLEIIYF